jgi:hypothetical protein
MHSYCPENIDIQKLQYAINATEKFLKNRYEPHFSPELIEQLNIRLSDLFSRVNDIIKTIPEKCKNCGEYLESDKYGNFIQHLEDYGDPYWYAPNKFYCKSIP